MYIKGRGRFPVCDGLQICLKLNRYNAKEDGGEPSSDALLKRGESLVINQNNL